MAAFNFGWARFQAGEIDETAAPLLDAVALASCHEQWIRAGDAHAIIDSCPDPGVLSQRVEEVAHKLTGGT